jgi:hypothetical protein
VTAEVATGFLRNGGWAVVSEPPGGDPARWPEPSLRGLGLGAAVLAEHRGAWFAALPKQDPALPDVPRSTRRLVKRPAW